MQKKSAIVSVTNDLVTDNRVRKVCEFLSSEGYEVLLVGRKLSKSLILDEKNYRTKRFLLFFNKGPLFYLEYNIRLFIFLLFHRSDLLVSNDLDTLLANYLAFKCKKCKLVYDTHEYFTEVPELIENPIKQRIWLNLEKRIFPKLKNIITVNDSIAKLYSDKYHVKVSVIRNVAPTLEFIHVKSRSELNLPEDKFIIILQGSGINLKRGAEEAVAAMINIENALLLIIGGGDVIATLKKMVDEFQIQERVKFLPKMSYEEMMEYTRNANLGLAIDHNDVLNHKLALPNKLFDYIQSEIPILSTDLIEVRKIIEKYEIGFVLEHELTSENLARKLNEIISMDVSEIKKIKENLRSAKKEENWEKERVRLKKIYDNLL